MRDLTKRDVIMFENVLKMLRSRVKLKSMELEETLGAAQTWQWLQGFFKEIQNEFELGEKKKAIEAALASAKPVDMPVVVVPKKKDKPLKQVKAVPKLPEASL